MSKKKARLDMSRATNRLDWPMVADTLSASAVLLGIFLPWYRGEFIGQEISAGPGLTSSVGVLLFCFALVSLLSGTRYLRERYLAPSILSLVTGIACVIICLNNWPQNAFGDVAGVQFGYWLTLAGAIGLSVMAVYESMQIKPTKRRNG